MTSEIVPYSQLADTINEKVVALGPYQQADCTAEFDALSTRLYGGNIFGENGTATCSNTSAGPAIHFFDRAITQQFNHGRSPLHVATLNSDGLHIAQEGVFVEWLTKRSVGDNTEFVFTGFRDAVLQSPLQNAKTIPADALHDLVTKAARVRIEQHAGASGLPFATSEEITRQKEGIAAIAASLDHPYAADIAEVFGTGYKLIPHVLRTPEAAPSVEAMLGNEHEVLRCHETGLWIATHHLGMQTVRGERFFARKDYRDRIIEEFEATTQASGPRIVKAVGRDLDTNEQQVMRLLGRGLDETAKGLWGNAYATPYTIEPSAFPYGTLLKGIWQRINFRIYLPSETIVA